MGEINSWKVVSLLVVIGLLATTGGTVQADRFTSVGQAEPSAAILLAHQDDSTDRTPELTVRATTNVTIQVPDPSAISVSSETNARTPSGEVFSVQTNDDVRRTLNETGGLTFVLNVAAGTGHTVDQEFTIPVTGGNDLSVSQSRTVTQKSDRGATTRYTVRVQEGDTLYLLEVRVTVEAEGDAS